MDKKYFEDLVQQSVNNIPEEFRKEIDNVNFFVQELPNAQQVRKLRLREKGHSLLGLYEGVPLTKRGIHYHSALPDRITIFRIPILRIARSEGHLKRIVDDTVWHEIAHYFGMNEDEVRRAEAKRKKDL